MEIIVKSDGELLDYAIKVGLALHCDILGFNNQNYFSIVFKRETSMSPLNYRKNILGK